MGRMDIWSMEEIIELLREQANMRSLENDEAGILEEAAQYIEREDQAIRTISSD